MRVEKHDAHYLEYVEQELRELDLYTPCTLTKAEVEDREWEEYLDSPEYHDWLEAEVEKAVNPEYY